MEAQQEKVIDVLNKLIEYCKDGVNGYREAHDHIEQSDVRPILYRLSQQRALFMAELEQLIRDFGGDIDEDGSITGALHRTWIDIKSMFTSKDVESILNECQRGDSAAIEAYEDALKEEDLPDYMREVIANQHMQIKAAYTQLDEFKQEFQEMEHKNS